MTKLDHIFSAVEDVDYQKHIDELLNWKPSEERQPTGLKAADSEQAHSDEELSVATNASEDELLSTPGGKGRGLKTLSRMSSRLSDCDSIILEDLKDDDLDNELLSIEEVHSDLKDCIVSEKITAIGASSRILVKKNVFWSSNLTLC